MRTMSRRQRTRWLVLAPGSVRSEWAASIHETETVQVLESPRAGLVMIRVRESARSSLFYVGEVLVSQAKVRVRGETGWGWIQGDDGQAALDLAVIDAACRAQCANVGEWLSRLESQGLAWERARAETRRRLGASRVDFQTMDREAAP